MDHVKVERQRLARTILDLERKIVAWNSSSKESKQTFEEWKKELQKARETYASKKRT